MIYGVIFSSVVLIIVENPHSNGKEIFEKQRILSKTLDNTTAKQKHEHDGNRNNWKSHGRATRKWRRGGGRRRGERLRFNLMMIFASSVGMYFAALSFLLVESVHCVVSGLAWDVFSMQMESIPRCSSFQACRNRRRSGLQCASLASRLLCRIFRNILPCRSHKAFWTRRPSQRAKHFFIRFQPDTNHVFFAWEVMESDWHASSRTYWSFAAAAFLLSNNSNCCIGSTFPKFSPSAITAGTIIVNHVINVFLIIV